MSELVKASVLVVEDWYNDPLRAGKRRRRKVLPAGFIGPVQSPSAGLSEAELLCQASKVERGQAVLQGTTPMTTIHGKPEAAAKWSDAVGRQSKLVAPDRKPQFAEWFRFYARLGAMQSPKHAARPDPCLDEREGRKAMSAFDERRTSDVLNALERTPYVVEYRDGSFQLFGRGREAIREARGHRGAVVHFVSMTYRVLDALTQVLPRPDRARGPSGVLQGQGTKFLQHRVATSLTSVRVF